MAKNRGKQLEDKIECLFSALERYFGIMYTRVHVPMKLTKYGLARTEKQYCDYIVTTKAGTTWYIDAKECSTDKFYFSNQKRHQVDALSRANSLPNTKGAFLVWFRASGYGDDCMRIFRDFSKPVTVSDGDPFSPEVFTGEKSHRITPEQYRETVIKHRCNGMSYRAIAKKTGLTLGVVNHILRGVSVDTPDIITGVDGKLYTGHRCLGG